MLPQPVPVPGATSVRNISPPSLDSPFRPFKTQKSRVSCLLLLPSTCVACCPSSRPLSLHPVSSLLLLTCGMQLVFTSTMSNLECEDEQATPSNSHPPAVPLEVTERSSLSDASQRIQEGASMEHASLLLSKRHTGTDENWRNHAPLVQYPCARPDVDCRARLDNPILHRTVPRQAVRYYPRPCHFASRLSPVVSSSTCPCVGWPSTRVCRKRAPMSWSKPCFPNHPLPLRRPDAVATLTFHPQS